MKFAFLGVKNRPNFRDFCQATHSHPTPLPQKNLQILFDIQVANKILRILTEGIVKISKKYFSEVKKRR